MELHNFIKQLLTDGSVSIHGNIVSFRKNDEEKTTELLYQYYLEDKLEMPLAPPAFDKNAAIWAAKYFYNALQLTVLRNETETSIYEKLNPYNEVISTSSIYSIDLIFRYLPDLIKLVKGLAPSDILVKILTETASDWPFSSVGVELNSIRNEGLIFTESSLKITYIDRIIYAKDSKRIIDNQLHQHITDAAGLYLNSFWPKSLTIFK